ncbi:hypothetical protein TruAng_002522 [Truncatella angustata]|nr:hypothetical protein TruAng_002522 [Truncatella angustata]
MRKWAIVSEWEEHKGRITDLYWRDDMPLIEVASVMGTEHGFHATPKMYKARFKMWGLRKNLSQRKRSRVLNAASQPGCPAASLALCRRELATARLDQKVECSRRQLIPGPSSRPKPVTTLPGLSVSVLEAPDELSGAEKCIRCIVDYTQNRLETGAWKPNRYNISQDTAALWFMETNLVIKLLLHDRAWPQAFDLLRMCFLECEARLDRQEPALMLAFLVSALGLRSVSHDLWPSHPFSVLFSQLIKSQSHGSSDWLRAMAGAQHAAIRENTKPYAYIRNISNISTMHSLKALVSSGKLSYTEAEVQFAEMTREMVFLENAADNIAWLCWVRISWARIRCEFGKYDEAQALLEGLPGEPLSQAVYLSNAVPEDVLMARGRILLGLGKDEESAQSFERALAVCDETMTFESTCVAWELYTYYLTRGSTNNAQNAKAVFQKCFRGVIGGSKKPRLPPASSLGQI